MKTRKLSSHEIFEIIDSEFNNNGEFKLIEDMLETAKAKVFYIESIPEKSKFVKWIDRHQSSLWFFIMLTSVAFTVKVLIENYTFKN